MDKTYTMDEIMRAFARIKESLDSDFGPGTGASERFLIDDVAADLRALLESGGFGTAPVAEEETFEREADDDETLYIGQNYNWFAAEGEW